MEAQLGEEVLAYKQKLEKERRRMLKHDLPVWDNCQQQRLNYSMFSPHCSPRKKIKE